MRTIIVALFVFLFSLQALQAQDTATATIDNPKGVMPSMREDGVDPDLAYAGKTDFGQVFEAEDDGCIPAGTKFVFPKRKATPEDRAKNLAFLARSGAARGSPCVGRGAKYLQPSPELLIAKLQKENIDLKAQHASDASEITALKDLLATANGRITSLEAELFKPIWRTGGFQVLVVVFVIGIAIAMFVRARARASRNTEVPRTTP